MENNIFFRAWDNKKNRYWYNIQIAGVYQEIDPDDPEEFSFEDFIIDKERFIIEQGVGIKDEEDYDIFAGDRVFVTWVNGQGDTVSRQGVVEYNAPSFMIKVVRDGEVWPFSFNYFETINVIGNIHQPPKKLTEK